MATHIIPKSEKRIEVENEIAIFNSQPLEVKMMILSFKNEDRFLFETLFRELSVLEKISYLNSNKK